jgi:hypothetical protein
MVVVGGVEGFVVMVVVVFVEGDGRGAARQRKIEWSSGGNFLRVGGLDQN